MKIKKNRNKSGKRKSEKTKIKGANRKSRVNQNLRGLKSPNIKEFF
jgi:hypothetical protein